jgi:hypothetical protein
MTRVHFVGCDEFRLRHRNHRPSVFRRRDRAGIQTQAARSADLNHRKISQVRPQVGEIDRGGKQLLHDAHVGSDPLSQASCVGDQRCPRSRILPHRVKLGSERLELLGVAMARRRVSTDSAVRRTNAGKYRQKKSNLLRQTPDKVRTAALRTRHACPQ